MQERLEQPRRFLKKGHGLCRVAGRLSHETEIVVDRGKFLSVLSDGGKLGDEFHEDLACASERLACLGRAAGPGAERRGCWKPGQTAIVRPAVRAGPSIEDDK